MEYNERKERVCNRFVKQLVGVMELAATSIHETQLKLSPPVKTPTAYGGRLTWILPGGNLLKVHIKDRNKIRKRKRWSQAENTYLLTLDGDIDFKAESVTLLVDRMRKNKKVGAACGRIHPIGT
ncbi:Chitin synthase chs-2, partial [Lamellibrachia satsuma]